MASDAPGSLSPATVMLLAATCGLLIANLYFVQPIAALVIRDFGLPLRAAGILAALPLGGYGLGLLLAVPLGDTLENRRLILAMTAAEAVILLLLWLANSAAVFLGLSLFAGLAASAIQVILPYASRFFTGAAQGRVVAQLVSGVMFGILVARPVSSFIAQTGSWRAIYLIAAGLSIAAVGLLALTLPPRRPEARQTYLRLLGSMAGLYRGSELLQRRALYQSALFGAFISFWTSAPLWLARAPFKLSQGGIAWVALAGVAGALAPPFATRLVDRGLGRTITLGAMVLAIAAFGVSLLGARIGVAAVVAAAVLLDVAASTSLVVGQRAVYSTPPQLRGRRTALFISTFFAAGAVASSLAAWCFVSFGWTGVAALGSALPFAALLYGLTERSSSEPGPLRKSAPPTPRNHGRRPGSSRA